jgi:hypothetical protein
MFIKETDINYKTNWSARVLSRQPEKTNAFKEPPEVGTRFID